MTVGAHEHQLTLRLAQQVYPTLKTWYCDFCRASANVDDQSFLWHCESCSGPDFDMCEQCVSKDAAAPNTAGPGSSNPTAAPRVRVRVTAPAGVSAGTMLTVKHQGNSYRLPLPAGVADGEIFVAEVGPHNQRTAGNTGGHIKLGGHKHGLRLGEARAVYPDKQTWFCNLCAASHSTGTGTNLWHCDICTDGAGFDACLQCGEGKQGKGANQTNSSSSLPVDSAVATELESEHATFAPCDDLVRHLVVHPGGAS